jgi:hypothetical protein
VRVSTFDLADPELYRAVEEDWREIKLTVAMGEIATYSSAATSDGVLQLRSVGTKRQLSLCPVTGERFPSLAFYATKRLVKAVMGL